MLVARTYSDAMRVKNLLEPEREGYQLFIRNNSLAVLKNFHELSPDILLLKDSAAFLDINVLREHIKQRQLETKIIMLEDFCWQLPPSNKSDIGILLEWNSLTRERLVETIQSVLSRKDQPPSMDLEVVEAGNIRDAQQAIKSYAAQAGSALLHLAQLKYAQPELTREAALSLQETLCTLFPDSNSLWLVRRNAQGVYLLFSAERLNPLSRNRQVLLITSQMLHKAAAVAQNGVSMQLSTPRQAEYLDLMFEELRQLEAFRYFCDDLHVITMSYIEAYRKQLDSAALENLTRCLLAQMLAGEADKAAVILQQIYTKQLKPAMHHGQLQLFRERFDDGCLRILAALSGVAPDHSQWGKFWSIEQEASYACERLRAACLRAGSVGAVVNPYVIRTLSYIADHYGEQISLNDITNALGLSKPYLCRIFKENTGQSVGNYLQVVRVQAAKVLIMDGEYKMSTVAKKCGFADAKYFARVFRQQVGTSPSAFRDRVMVQNALQKLGAEVVP